MKRWDWVVVVAGDVGGEMGGVSGLRRGGGGNEKMEAGGVE